LPFKTNYPYLSGDVFADMCDAKLEDGTLDREELLQAKTIFIKSDLLAHYLKRETDLFRNKIVIAGNGDTNFDSPSMFASKVKALLAQNMVFNNHSNFYTIPIGLENLRLRGSGYPRYHQQVRNFAFNEKVLVPPMGMSNPVRHEIMEKVTSNISLFYVSQSRLPRKKYFELVQRFRFVLALEGNGFDTHRLWEILYQGSFPIVFYSDWMKSLDYLGLPIFKVEDLREINKKSLVDFLEKNAEYEPSRAETLWAPYWKTFITKLSEDI
jgi:hypothetical protein